MDNQQKLEDLQGTICRLSKENARLYEAYIQEAKKANEVAGHNLEQKNRIEELERISAKHDSNQRMLIEEKEKLLNTMKNVEKQLHDREREVKRRKTMAIFHLLKDRETNAELQEARRELINVLETLASSSSSSSSKAETMKIGVKRFGNLDFMPFLEAMKIAGKKNQDAIYAASNLCAKWEENIREPFWYPFKVLNVRGKPVEIIDDNDEKLKALFDEMGEEVYKAVTTALTERKDYNPKGQRNVVQELWNIKENRKATLKEGIAFITEQYLENDVQDFISRNEGP